jgi:hypothetical protein
MFAAIKSQFGEKKSFLRFDAAAGLPDGICIFKPKIQIWVNFGGSCSGRCWYISWPSGFYSHLVYFVVI